MSLIKQHSC